MVEEEHEKPSGASRVSADIASGHQSVWTGASVLWRADHAVREPTTSWPVIVLRPTSALLWGVVAVPGQVQHRGRERNQQARQQHICAPHMTASACAPGAVVAVRTMCVMTTTLSHAPRNNASLPCVP